MTAFWTPLGLLSGVPFTLGPYLACTATVIALIEAMAQVFMVFRLAIGHVYASASEALRHSSFQVVSKIKTTSIALWPRCC